MSDNDSGTISWHDFERVELRGGTIVDVEEVPEARKPAYRLRVDLGAIGIKRSSAQVTRLYTREELVGRQVICVTNFPPKQIGPFISEVLVTGFVRAEGAVALATPEREAPTGPRLS